VGQNIHNPQVLQFHHHFEGTGVQEIADQYTGSIAPASVCSAAAPAKIRGVHYVIVK
jgi:hypothetical protein